MLHGEKRGTSHIAIAIHSHIRRARTPERRCTPARTQGGPIRVAAWDISEIMEAREQSLVKDSALAKIVMTTRWPVWNQRISIKKMSSEFHGSGYVHGGDSYRFTLYTRTR